MGLLSLVIPGLIAGFIARVVVRPGRQLGCLGTILLGVMGSFVGGALGSLLSDDGFSWERSQWLGSILGAVVILVVLRFFNNENEQW